MRMLRLPRYALLLAGALALPILAALSRSTAAAPAAPRPRRPARPAGAGVAFPFPVNEKTLANGLRVYVVGYDSPGLVAYYSVVRTGSRNEVEPGKSGFAHFFEHMMFHGTEKYTLDAYNAVIKQMGADSNAFTSDDLTVYHILAGKQALPQDRRDRERSLPAPHLPAARLPEGGARRPRRVQQERLQPDGEDGRDALRPRLHHAHLQAHDDGLPEGHREHAQRDGLLAAVLRPVLSSRERRLAGRRRRRPRGGLQAGRRRATAAGRPAARTRSSRSSRRRRRSSARS